MYTTTFYIASQAPPTPKVYIPLKVTAYVRMPTIHI